MYRAGPLTVLPHTRAVLGSFWWDRPHVSVRRTAPGVVTHQLVKVSVCVCVVCMHVCVCACVCVHVCGKWRCVFVWGVCGCVSLVVSLLWSAPQYRVRVCPLYQDLGFVLYCLDSTQPVELPR